jgi:Sec-independent protein translocase protein TatA
VVDNSSSMVTLHGTTKDTPKAVKLFRKYMTTLKEEEVFDAQPAQDKKEDERRADPEDWDDAHAAFR